MAKFEPKPFGKHFLTDRIAIGGMAEIYKAKTFGVDGFEKVLAIKKILAHYSADKEFITMLTDEAKLVVNLSHANIVQVYDLGRVGDDYFISMEYIDGINLRDLIERSRELDEAVPIDVAVYVLSEVCRGLDYAHNRKDVEGKPLKIIHRDISPQNILVSYDGGVKIVDFGIAKAAYNLSQTHAGILKGKVNYMAPEQAFGKPMDHRSDIFSLGIVLFELLTNKRLFHGETQMEILKKIRNNKITEATFEKEEIPAFLKPLIAKSLAYSPNKRYGSAADLQIDLTRILYSTYNDFTPRKLTELLDRWFSDRRPNDDDPEDDERETVLVSSTDNQVDQQINIVHRDESLDLDKDSLDVDMQEETISPEDGLTGDYFKEPDDDIDDDIKDEHIEKTEKTEKSEVTHPRETIDDLLRRKETQRIKAYRRTSIWVIIFFIFCLVFGYYLFNKYHEEIFNFINGQEIEVVPIDPNEINQEKPSLKIVSEPSGASVWFNGEKTQKTTPADIESIELNKKHSIKLVLEGFAEAEQDITLTKTENQLLTFNLKAISAKTYPLVIESTPSGAQVYLDGKDTGKKTPARIEKLIAEQSYKITLKLDKYEAYEETVVQKNDKEKKVESILVPIPLASVVISSAPKGADIYINGEKTPHQTPYTFKDLSVPSKLSVTLKKEGYHEVVEDFSIEAAKKYKKDLKLKEIIVEVPVKVTTNISGAQVYIGKKKMGTAPLTFKLTPGRHKLYVKRNKYQTQSKTVLINKKDKDLKKYYFKLIKEPVAATTTTTTTTTTKPVDSHTTMNTTTTNVAQQGKLRVDSSPRGASVSINGAGKGITPLVVSGLPKNKSLTISVSKKGYRTWKRTINLTRDRTEISAVLTK